MSTRHQLPTSAVARYERSLRNRRKSRLPAGTASPAPPEQWPEENRLLFEKYLTWLVADAAGVSGINLYYLPMAGHVLGLTLKPHQQLKLDSDLEKALDFVRVIQPSERWLRFCRMGVERFRRFLQEERGISPTEISFKSINLDPYHEGLPDWLIEQLTHYQRIRQANWRPSRMTNSLLRFWNKHTRLWRWLFAHHPIEQVTDVKRAFVYAYIDERLAENANPKTVNQELRSFQATLYFLQEREYLIPRALLKLSGLKEPDSLPRFLTDEQVVALRDDLEERVRSAASAVKRREALLDRVSFYLLWQAGLRVGEAEELLVNDLNPAQKQIVIRRGKGLQDRAVYLTETALQAVTTYMAVRGESLYDHLLLYRHRPVNKDFIRARLRAAGRRTGVKVTPHQLRHTYATQLVNAGCKITTIQALLGHRRLNTTLTYARVHDRTVAEDYYAAMDVVEKRLAPHLHLPEVPEADHQEQGETAAAQLLTLLTTLQAEPLTQNQQEVVTQLQQGLTMLADTLPATSRHTYFTVNEPVMT